MSLKVAVIGSGITGLSLAYFLKDEEIELQVFERGDRIGGRIKTVEFSEELVEIGAVYYHSTNKLVSELVNDFNLNFKPLERQRVGLWDGERFVFKTSNSELLTQLKMLWKFGFGITKLGGLIGEVKDMNSSFYTGLPFTTVEEFLGDGMMRKSTSETVVRYLKSRGFSDKIIQNLVLPTLRYVYHHAGSSDSNAFSGIVSLIAYDSDPVYYLPEGNFALIENLASKISKVHLNSPIEKIEQLENGVMINDELKFDMAVICTPLEISNIELTNVNNKGLMINTFKGYYKTLVKGYPNLDYFGTKSMNDLPPMILTTMTSPFYGFEKIRDSTIGGDIYEITSSTQLSDDILNNLFTKIEISQSFELPYTFADLKVKNSFPPIIISKDIYYANAMDTIIATMESSVLMGLNISKLIMERT